MDEQEVKSYENLNDVIQKLYSWVDHINEDDYKQDFENYYKNWLDTLKQIPRVKGIRDIYQIWGLWLNYLNQKIQQVDFEIFNVYVYLTHNLIIGDVEAGMSIFELVLNNYKENWETFSKELIAKEK